MLKEAVGARSTYEIGPIGVRTKLKAKFRTGPSRMLSEILEVRRRRRQNQYCERGSDCEDGFMHVVADIGFPNGAKNVHD